MRKSIICCAAVLSSIVACSSKTETQGQLMLSMQTDLSLPKDVDTVRIEVSTFGKVNFAQDYPVGPSGAKIPATLGIVAGSNKAAPVRIRIIAKLAGTSRLLREAVTTVPSARIASLRMPLQYLSLGQVVATGEGSVNNGNVTPSSIRTASLGTLEGDGSQNGAELVADSVQSSCGAEMTSDNGVCVSVNVDSNALPDYAPADVFGGGDETGSGGVCFDTVNCMSGNVDVAVNTNGCTIARPESDSINVALRLPPGKEGICDAANSVCFVPLDAESDSGWRTSNGAIVLPQAACAKVAQGAIAGIVVSTSCPTKSPSVPTCGPWSGVTTPATFEAGAPAAQGGDAVVPSSGREEAGVGGSDRDATAIAPDASTEPPDAGVIDKLDSGTGTLTDAGDPKVDASLDVDAGVLGPGQVVRTGDRTYGLTVDSASATLFAQEIDGAVFTTPLGAPTWKVVVGPLSGITQPGERFVPRMGLFNYGNAQLFRGNAVVSPYLNSIPLLTLIPSIIGAPGQVFDVAGQGANLTVAGSGAEGFGLYSCSNTACSVGLWTPTYTPSNSIGRIGYGPGGKLFWAEANDPTNITQYSIVACDPTSSTTCSTTKTTLATIPDPIAPHFSFFGEVMVWTNPKAGSIHSCQVSSCAGSTTTLASGQLLSFPTPFTNSLAHYVVTDGANVYWTTNDGYVRHTLIAKPGAIDVVSYSQPNPTALALAGGQLYWSNVGGDLNAAGLATPPANFPSVVRITVAIP